MGASEDKIDNLHPIAKETSVYFPSSAYRKLLKEERRERMTGDKANVTGRNILFQKRKLSLGVSSCHYRFFLLLQFYGLYYKKGNIHYEGLENISPDSPTIFVMKHRAYSDITLHGLAYTLRCAGVQDKLRDSDYLNKKDQVRQDVAKGRDCRFIMKEDLLSLPIGFHLTMNGGIPVLQDLETKAKNTPGFDPKDEKVLKQRKKMSTWFSFKDSYREITQVLKDRKGVMLYGEATRVSGDSMGHINTTFLARLTRIPDVQIIPVGSVVKGKDITIKYGPQCKAEELRDNIAELSEISKDKYLP